MIVSRMQPIINMHRVLALGGSKPPPYDEHSWQAEHPAVHRMQLTGQLCPDPQIYGNWQIKMTCQLLCSISPLRTSRFWCPPFLSLILGEGQAVHTVEYRPLVGIPVGMVAGELPLTLEGGEDHAVAAVHALQQRGEVHQLPSIRPLSEQARISI